MTPTFLGFMNNLNAIKTKNPVNHKIYRVLVFFKGNSIRKKQALS